MTLIAAAPDTAAAAGRSGRVAGWIWPLLVTVLGGVLRLWQLGTPHAFVFDETYYAKDGLSLLLFGYERTAMAGANELILASDGTPDPDWFDGRASFVVHPPVGKWLIAFGEHVFGATPFGWRIAAALVGTVSILLLARVVLRMTGSVVWGTVAGLLLAIDGMAIVMSRTAVLDGFLMFFVLAGFGLLLIDRDGARAGRWTGPWWRPFRLVAAIALGLAIGVKWSGLWYLAGFAVLTVLWEAARRRRTGQRWLPAVVVDAVPTALTMLPVAAAVYLASWWSWFATDGGWDRQWDPGTGPVAALRSLWHYHAEMWGFHTNLSQAHGYQSSAWGWLVQARPTSFFYDGKVTGCPSGACSQAVNAIGNPIIWWAAAAALAYQVWRWAGHRDWRSGAVLLGVLAGWAPWLMFPDRTVFSFYSIVFAPFLIMALTLTLAAFADPLTVTVPPGTRDPGAADRILRRRRIIAGGFVLVCVAVSWWFLPIWTAEIIDHSAWSLRMWLPSWV